jgi:SAM-dependent methyltransferase
MDYDDATAERMEAGYRGPDVSAQRAHVQELLALQPGEAVIDIGSGPGFLASEMAETVGPSGSVLGIDKAPVMLRRASARNTRPWLRFGSGDAMALPVADSCVDVAVCTQVAEYLSDTARFCAEFARVLRPGGRGLILTTDWNALRWNTADPGRMAMVVEALISPIVHHDLPLRLAGLLRGAGLTVRRVEGFALVNHRREAGSYGMLTEGFAESAARAAGFSTAMVDAWCAELEALDAAGAYFISVPRYSFVVDKPA